jgi:hypothetical protein
LGVCVMCDAVMPIKFTSALLLLILGYIPDDIITAVVIISLLI